MAVGSFFFTAEDYNLHNTIIINLFTLSLNSIYKIQFVLYRHQDPITITDNS